MNELVKKLSSRKHPVIVNNPDKSPDALKERLKLNYLHVLFSETGTEIGIYLHKTMTNTNSADFNNGKGEVHAEGILTLNYHKVRCVVDFQLDTMGGTGYLETIDEKEYEQILKEKL